MGPSLNVLGEQFDDVKLWYPEGADGERRGHTIAVLWKGDKRYFGVSCLHPDDTFNKKRGRAIALGRAFCLYDTESKNLPVRPNLRNNRTARVYHASELPADKLNLALVGAQGGTKQFEVPNWLYLPKGE